MTSSLRLKRFVIRGYKSIKDIQVDLSGNLAVFVGRNDAGKSNLLDFFNFLRDSRSGFQHALNGHGRGEDLRDVLHRKSDSALIEAELDFDLHADERSVLVGELFAKNENVSAEQVLATEFLKSVSLHLRFGKSSLFEELNCSNMHRGEPACTIFRIVGTPEKLTQFYGNLEVACKKDFKTVVTDPREAGSSSGGGQLTRISFGSPDGNNPAWVVSQKIGGAVKRIFENLQSIDPFRVVSSKMPIQGTSTLASNASNLPDVMHWLYNNKPARFMRIYEEIAKLIPHLGQMYTPTHQNTATVGISERAVEDVVYTLNQMSAGTKCGIALITKVILADPGTWLTVEEPESYLHPKAQVALFRFLEKESTTKTLLVTTHSGPIAASTPLTSLYLVRRDENNCTVVDPIGPTTIDTVIEELGIRPSFNFEADATVFVEGKDDVPIYEAWAKMYPFEGTVQFLDAEGGSTLHYFANAKVALSKYSKAVVYVVFDGDTERENRDKKTKERLVAELDLSTENILTLEMNEVEGYLLDPVAIRRAFSAIDLSQDELETRLAPFRKRRNQKKGLEELFRDFGIGKYDGKLAARIAQSMHELPGSISSLFSRINNGLIKHRS